MQLTRNNSRGNPHWKMPAAFLGGKPHSVGTPGFGQRVSTLARRLVAGVPPPAWHWVEALRGAPWPYCVVAFHRLGTAADDELSYPAAAFAALCRYWRDHYEIISLDCLLARLAHRDPGRHPTLTITFDDGYADNYEVAAPILDQLDLSATFFVTTGAMGTPNHFAWDTERPAPPPLMSWRQVRELRGAGFGIGSHTVSHVRLSRTRGTELARELEASRRSLEEELGEAALDFAYPFGGADDCDHAAREAVRRAGYRCCLACHGGLVAASDSAYRLNRICVSPRYHGTPRDWARHYARLRWCAAGRADSHW